MTYETILFERIGHVAKITFNRPEAMNSVNPQLWQETGEALEQFDQDPELWVAIVTGAGDRAFCAGADLKVLAAGAYVITDQMAEWGFAGIVRHFVSKPLIAAVNGFALGGGTEIALACDLVIASEDAKFGQPEVKRGILAAAGGLLRLPRQIPLKVAMNCILTGDPMPAVEALRWGLVNQVVPKAELMSAAMALAEKICENAPLALRASKTVVYQGLDVSLDFPGEAWDLNDRWAADVLSSVDAKEGPRAFAEKRKPAWQAR